MSIDTAGIAHERADFDLREVFREWGEADSFR